MKTLFADTCYWMAIASKGDTHHQKAEEVNKSLWPFYIVTTDEVLIEFLNLISCREPRLRPKAAELAEAVLNDPGVTVLPQTRKSFLDGLARYGDRRDKEYSLTDCIGMNVMDTQRLSEALTADRDFEREGYTALLR